MPNVSQPSSAKAHDLLDKLQAHGVVTQVVHANPGWYDFTIGDHHYRGSNIREVCMLLEWAEAAVTAAIHLGAKPVVPS